MNKKEGNQYQQQFGQQLQQQPETYTASSMYYGPSILERLLDFTTQCLTIACDTRRDKDVCLSYFNGELRNNTGVINDIGEIVDEKNQPAGGLEKIADDLRISGAHAEMQNLGVIHRDIEHLHKITDAAEKLKYEKEINKGREIPNLGTWENEMEKNLERAMVDWNEYKTRNKNFLIINEKGFDFINPNLNEDTKEKFRDSAKAKVKSILDNMMRGMSYFRDDNTGRIYAPLLISKPCCSICTEVLNEANKSRAGKVQVLYPASHGKHFKVGEKDGNALRNFLIFLNASNTEKADINNIFDGHLAQSGGGREMEIESSLIHEAKTRTHNNNQSLELGGQKIFQSTQNKAGQRQNSEDNLNPREKIRFKQLNAVIDKQKTPVPGWVKPQVAQDQNQQLQMVQEPQQNQQQLENEMERLTKIANDANWGPEYLEPIKKLMQNEKPQDINIKDIVNIFITTIESQKKTNIKLEKNLANIYEKFSNIYEKFTEQGKAIADLKQELGQMKALKNEESQQKADQINMPKLEGKQSADSKRKAPNSYLGDAPKEEFEKKIKTGGSQESSPGKHAKDLIKSRSSSLGNSDQGRLGPN